jgi:hypothetical protein
MCRKGFHRERRFQQIVAICLGVRVVRLTLEMPA